MLGTRSGSVSLRSAVGPVYGAVSTSGYRSDGYNISHFGSEKDGSSANSASGKFGIDLTDNLNVEAVVRYSRRSADGDPQDFTGGSPTYGLLLDGDQRTDHEGLAARVGATLKLFDSRWIQSINAKIFDETLTSFSGGAFSSSLGGKRHAYDYKSTVKFATNVAGGERHTFSVLADRRTENYSASFLGGSTFEKSRLGLAAEYLVDLSTFTALSGAIRHDWNEPFENALSWRLALSQQFPSTASRLHASMGKGITDPDHTEILGYPAFFILPNPNLKPESSLGWDVGLEQKWWNGLIVTDVTYFDTRFRDKIEASFVGFNTLYVNAGGISKRRGVEVSATLNPTDRVSITAAYTFTHARNSLNVPELRRPEHSGSIETSFLSADRRGRATIGASYNGERRDIRFNEFPAPNSFVIMPDTTIFWASLSYDVTQNANVFVRAENLFNKRYEEIFSFRAQPLAVFAGMRVKLGAE
jgi:vitamin B12 transporter